MPCDKDTLILLCETMNDREIGDLYGVTPQAIRCWKKKLEVTTPASNYVRRGNRKYTIDHRYFSSIDSEEKAYILGFIIADGFIHKNGKNIGFTLHEKDTHILDDIKLCMSSNAPTLNKTNTIHEHLHNRYVQLNLCSTQLVKCLNVLGVTNNKSSTIRLPTINPSLNRHLIRGIFDGDGYIGKRQFILASGSAGLVSDITSIISKETHNELSILPKDSSYRLIGYRRDSESIKWLYHNSRIFLHRKKVMFETYWD